MIGSLRSVVIDCPDPDSLSNFYEKLLGMHRDKIQEDWIEIKRGELKLCFQRATDYQPPAWPDPTRPQQMHLDVSVDDVDEAERKVLELGATKLPGEGGDFRVYADPAGHPFCLVFHPA